MNSVVQNHVEIIGVSQSEPHTNHSYKGKLCQDSTAASQPASQLSQI